MKILNKILILIALVAMSYSESCQLCMRTFKTICEICYDRCGNKQLQSCKYRDCLKRDDKDYCVEYGPEQTLDNSTCLPQCCEGSGLTAGFSEEKFNQCIEYDADQPNDINVGMTLGATLSLFFLLAMFGAAYLLSILCFDQKLVQENQKPANNAQVHPDVQNQNWHPSMLMPAHTPSWLKGEVKESKLISPCAICKSTGCNVLTPCKHSYHSQCLIPQTGESVSCAVCRKSCDVVMVYCSNCFKNYFEYHLMPKNTENFQNVKCQVCSES